MNHHRDKRPHGQIRQSQVVTTFGPGSMLDLPNQSVLVSGLDDWFNKGPQINEPRLLEKLSRLLDRGDLTLHAPPPDSQDQNAPPTGIRGWQFPEWFITQNVQERQGDGARTRRLVRRQSLTRGKYVDQDRRHCPVIPVRFV